MSKLYSFLFITWFLYNVFFIVSNGFHHISITLNHCKFNHMLILYSSRNVIILINFHNTMSLNFPQQSVKLIIVNNSTLTFDHQHYYIMLSI